MESCCSPGYDKVFSSRRAETEARRYRRQGLDAPSRRLFDAIVAGGVAEQSVLEVGGGVGALQIELLKAGASHAVNVELSSGWEQPAAGLIAEAGQEGRIKRERLDFAESAGELEPADLVVLHRVVCCYPDMPKMMAAAAGRTTSRLYLTFPKARWWSRLPFYLINLGCWLFRVEFRSYLHSPAAILAEAQRHGLTLIRDESAGVLWRLAAFSRPAA